MLSGARVCPRRQWSHGRWLRLSSVKLPLGKAGLTSSLLRSSNKFANPRCVSIRGVKTRTTIRIEDLPQGVLSEPEPKEAEPCATTVIYPTVIQQARNNMRKFHNCVVLTRVGGFYELYFEQAEHFGPLLNLRVGKKSTAVGPVPMAGFPFFQLDRFLRTLIQELDQAVAIAEEFPNSPSQKAKNGGLLFDRRVSRVVTSGTLVDERFIDPYENNFLLAIYAPNASPQPEKTSSPLETNGIHASSPEVGLAWVDLSTGELFTQNATEGTLSAALARINAKETIINAEISGSRRKHIVEAASPRPIITWNDVADLDTADWTTFFETSTVKKDASLFSTLEQGAASLILSYVQDRLQGLSAKLQLPVQWHEAENMGIDANTMKGLEILETSKEAVSGGKGSLLHSLRRTVSSGGARLLRSRLSSPSTSIDVINDRLDLVEHFMKHKADRDKLLELLKSTFDTQRLVQKFSLGRGDAADLISLCKTISATRAILELLGQSVPTLTEILPSNTNATALNQIMQTIDLESVDELSLRIAQAIDEDGLLEQERHGEAQAASTLETARGVVAAHGSGEDLEILPRTAKGKATNPSLRYPDGLQLDSWRMRKTANSVLTDLHMELDQLLEQKDTLERLLREEIKAPSLTLRWNPGQGHVCHVKGLKDVKASMDNLPLARNAGSSKSTRAFYHAKWTKLGMTIDQQRLRIVAEEDIIFNELRAAVIENLVRLRRNAAVLDQLDVACASSILAEEQGTIRPKVNNGTSHHLIGGRHATVKVGLEEQGRKFVSNDCMIGAKDHVWLITGPNMAGKSTFLRQNALISILTQVGLFVPADYADIGIVDHIFTRVGSADNLYRNQSTFMVEMLESAHILRTATPRSLVIMDEVGRGTTPEDGTAIAFACLHHLYHTNRCRTLFATHFHALVDLTKDWSRLGRYCSGVVEGANGSFHYDYRLQPGVNRESHALKVARLAGMPSAAIDVARELLDRGAVASGDSQVQTAAAGWERAHAHS